jgi:hypothetical protein
MIHYVIISIFWMLGACTTGNSEEKTTVISDPKQQNYTWKKIFEEGPWKKNYNFQMFSRRDTIWVFHPDGNWFSTDTKNWKKSTLPNAINNLAFLDYVPFNHSIYGLGHFKGNIEKFTFKPEIYQAVDMQKWKTMATKSNLPVRFFYHPFEFKGKLWIIGGEDSKTAYADIWNSDDGIKWVKQKDHLPFGKRSGSQFVILNNKIFMLNNDVWSSTDGLNWQKVSHEIVKGQTLFGYTALAFDNKIWLLGCTRNRQFTSQVLMSEDGKTWTGQDAPWSHRGGIAACAHQGKLYMTGGKFGGNDISHPEFVYSNDLWVLEKH